MTRVKFNCVQPIKLSEPLYHRLLLHKGNHILKDACNSEFTIPWLQELVKEYYKFRSYRSLKCLDIIDKKKLSNELLEDNYLIGSIQLGQYLVEKETLVEVVFDERFWSFSIVYEFNFDIPEKDLIAIAMIENDLSSYNDFYNKIRNIVVNPENLDEFGLSLWGNNIRNHIIENIEKFICNSLNISKNTYLNDSTLSVDIRNNTGNCTFYVLESAQKENLKNALIACNQAAEKTIKSSVDLMLGESVYYGFFGRFHTIMTDNIDSINRYAFIQYHMQYMWFQLGIISEALINLNSSIRKESIDTIYQEQREELVDEYINLVSHLTINNENFKLTIESDKSKIYDVIEKVWNVESSIINSKMYVEFFKEYCQRLFTRKLAKSSKRQNNILFGISVLQIISLLSVWSDYLDFSSKNLTKNYIIFSQLALPLILIAIVFFLFIAVWKK